MARVVLNSELVHLQTLTKRANQRLRQLETSGLKNSSAYNYVKTQSKTSKLYTLDKQGRIKFRTDLTKLTKRQIKDLTRVVNNFLDKKTSTVSGIKKTRQKAYETFINKYGLNITLDDFNILWNSSAFKSRVYMWSSDVAIDVISDMLDNNNNDLNKVLKILEENSNQTDIDFFVSDNYYNDIPFE